MAVETTLPGIQFYAGNYMAGCPAGKGGASYGRRDAVCLETQFFPDTPNRPEFPQCVLRPGEAWEPMAAGERKSMGVPSTGAMTPVGILPGPTGV